MKKFLKRANRGLLLGGFILVVLIIYIIADYVRFNSEKDLIRKELEAYLEDFYDACAKNDYSAITDTINENWTARPVMTTISYYTDKADMNEDLSATADFVEVSDASCSISKISIRKSGPNMARVDLTYSAELTYSGKNKDYFPFAFGREYNWYSDDENMDTCKSSGSFECTIYMYREDGSWKLSQAEAYIWDFNVTEVK